MRRIAAILVGLGLVAGGLVAFDRAVPPDLSRALTLSAELLDREGGLLAVRPAQGGVWRMRTTVRDVPPLFVEMLLAREDRRFRSHPGVDPLALARAVLQAVRHGRIVSGGSTLTMQVARLLEPRPRTLGAKAIEILRALQLEARFSKDEVLGLWLTLAPYGGNLEGVRAASYAFFGRPPSALNAGELALLVALPQRPSALRPDRHPERAARAQARVLALAREAGLLSEAEARGVGPLPETRLAMPARARHLFARAADKAGSRLATTLEAPLQAALERLAEEEATGFDPRANLAVLVLRNADRSVAAALCGLPGEARAGALDLCRAVRSPGSALKPILFALAIDAGLLRPETRISDLPQRFGAYAPENFARDFAGDLTARDALRLSLNVPAVAVADALGPLAFLAALKTAGIETRLPAGGAPGLPVALGGVGITLEDLVALTAALGDGRAGRVVWRAGERGTLRALVSPAAAGAVRAILAASPVPQGFPPQASPPRYAWKTGTSWGHRDAWAVGMSATHTIGVWVGRPDGTPLPGETGRRLALPLLLRAFALMPDPGPLPQAEPLPPAPALARLGAREADRLRLVFPPPGGQLALGRAVTLRAAGGQRPLTFLVDGAPVASERHRRDALWLPASPGAYRVTVIDSSGVAASADIRVR